MEPVRQGMGQGQAEWGIGEGGRAGDQSETFSWQQHFFVDGVKRVPCAITGSNLVAGFG